jgi:hypothetical protein
MSLRRLFAMASISLATFATPLVALAWNSPGHIIVALIAYDQLDPATKAKAVALLREHPRFNAHFQGEMPREIQRKGEHEKDEWVFAHAATWPDQVRDAKGGVNHQDVTEFHRPWWHFIDEPVFLNNQERKELQGQVRVNLRREPPEDRDDKDMNIIQALKNSKRIISDKSESNAKRAVQLCWLLHLTGDSHQPLHSVGLMTTHRFRGNDHGGNYLELEHKWELHAFWDEQISSDDPYETLRILATDLDKNPKLQPIGVEAQKTLDPDKWIDESTVLAKKYAYTPELMAKVSAREGHSHLGPLELSAQYKADAEEVGERRAMEAGYRLAKTIQQLLQ